jgi:hypothetical protein
LNGAITYFFFYLTTIHDEECKIKFVDINNSSRGILSTAVSPRGVLSLGDLSLHEINRGYFNSG